MKREELKALGLEGDVIDSIMAIHGKDIEANKAKVTQLEEQVNTLNTNIKERDTQLETLKKSTGDVESLKAQIASLQETNTTQANEYQNKMKDLQITSAIKLALNDKVHDADLVSGLLAKDKLVINDDGSIIGLDDQINNLKTSKAFLFKAETTEAGAEGAAGFKVGNPGGKDTGTPGIDAAIAAAFGNTSESK